MVLSLIGVGLAAAAISGLAEQSSKRAYPSLNEKEFDAINGSKGIAHGGYPDEKIMKIAARCGVKPNKHGVLPQNGKNNCIRYVTKYADHDRDIEKFKRAWDRTVENQIKKHGNNLKEKYARNYEYMKGIVERKGHGFFGGPTIVLEINHWHGINKKEQLKRMKELQDQTIWGDVCIHQPKLRHNPNFPGGFTEYWTLHGGKDDKQGKRSTIKKYKGLYTDCCAHIGYDAML